MPSQFHVGVLVEQRYLDQAQPAGMICELERQGHRVRLIDPLATAYNVQHGHWQAEFDVIVCRGRSWAVLCLLAWAERCGRPTINRWAAIRAVHDKATMAIMLAGNDIPTPPTFLGPVEHLAQHVPLSRYPVLLKPTFGDNCRGLQLVHSPDELRSLVWPEPVALAQHYLPSDGYDLKLYGIGNDVWAVRKPSPLHQGAPRASTNGGHGAAAEVVPLTPALRRLGQRCGALFGLELFGVDCVPTPQGAVVIEVNEFPTYSGVPEANKRLADYVVWRAAQTWRSEGAGYENRLDSAAV